MAEGREVRPDRAQILRRELHRVRIVCRFGPDLVEVVGVDHRVRDIGLG